MTLVTSALITQPWYKTMLHLLWTSLNLNQEMIFVLMTWVHGNVQDHDLHRMIAFVDSVSNSIIFSTSCLVQYWFESGDEHPVSIKSHGNSKRKTDPYCHTHPSTLETLKQEAKFQLPKGTVNTVYVSEGGMMQAKSLGKLPRNREQVANMRHTNSVSMCSRKRVERSTLSCYGAKQVMWRQFC